MNRRMVEITCFNCGIKALKLAGNVETRRKIGQSNFYCSVKCSAKTRRPVTLSGRKTEILPLRPY